MSKIQKNNPVIIIGAGVAGMYAARCLRQVGKPFVLLEATDKHGGRIRPLIDPKFSDFPIELGAENIHGDKNQTGTENSFLYRDIMQHNPNLLRQVFTGGPTQDELYQVGNETFWDSSYQHKEIDKVWKRLKKLKKYTGKDITVAQYLAKKGIDKDHCCWNFYQALIGAEYGTTVDELGMFSLAQERRNWKTGNKDYGFSEKNYLSTLEEIYFTEILPEIIYNFPVHKIDIKPQQVVVHGPNNLHYSSPKVLLTVPLGVLKANTIKFVPPLPKEKQLAIETIGMDGGMKIILSFRKRFWPKRMLGFLTNQRIGYGWATGHVRKSGSNRFLTCFIMGKRANFFATMTPEEQKMHCLQELDSLFPPDLATKHFVELRCMNWKKQPYIRGSYSYPSPNTQFKDGPSMRSLLAKPIGDRLFFAGEATAKNHPATVHGAMESARTTIRNMFPQMRFV